jgi:hypothetical protein
MPSGISPDWLPSVRTGEAVGNDDRQRGFACRRLVAHARPPDFWFANSVCVKRGFHGAGGRRLITLAVFSPAGALRVRHRHPADQLERVAPIPIATGFVPVGDN